jgi:glycosyltransferase involved in cell wall biosynthesis
MENNNTPLVSILMPVYNTSKYLAEALESVINQTYQNWELVAVDDGSTDDSYHILKRYAKKYPSIKVYKNKENLGVLHTLNYALSLSKGEFIARFDSDDMMPINRIKKQVNFLIKNPDIVVVGGQVMLIRENGSEIGYKNFPLSHEEIYKGMYTFMTVQQGGILVNTKLLPENYEWYFYNKSNGRVAEEVDFFFRLFNYGRMENIKDCVLKYRQYSNSTSLIDPKKTFYATFKSRIYAVKNYGYKPTIKARVLNIAQLCLITLLPKKTIYPIFISIRTFGNLRKKITGALEQFYNTNEIPAYKGR